MERSFAELDGRGLLVLAGEDRRSFLQGLVSNDVAKVAPQRALYAALLTPQGKYLHDFFLFDLGETLVVDGERPRLGDLKRRLALYKLRAKVTIDEAGPGLAVFAAFGEGALGALGLPAERGAAAPAAGDGLVFVDPRLADLGARLVAPREAGRQFLLERGFAPGGLGDYDRMRLALGVPDGSRDLVLEKSILLESGFDELGGVDWQKGCYVGQELTARTKYRGLIKKRLMPVQIDGPPPPPGTIIRAGEEEAGEMRSSVDGLGLALLRLEAVAGGAPLAAGEARLTPVKPDWARW